MNYKKLATIVSCLFLSLSLSAQITVVSNGQAKSRILVDKENKTDLEAANLLVRFVEEISGAKLLVLPAKETPEKGDILIGGVQTSQTELSEDAFLLSSNDGFIRIVGNHGKGSIYGAITLLEDYLGIRYLAENSYTLNQSEEIVIAETINRIEIPSYSYRQTQAYSIVDPIYKLWHRLETPDEVFADNLWVHTFNHILPSSEFGESHPEYYSFISGQRRPGTASQWCLTNPEVFEIVAHRLDSIFKKDPDKHIISVSQNDSQTYCHCPECSTINDREKSPSGTNIYFLNKLAEKFPDKEFSTLAYLYSQPAPKHIKPLPNVNIMLCDIDAYRELTLTENPSGQMFVRDMENWAKITNNIFVWDYGINFDNYIAPFPNFHILQPNMQLFKKNGTTMHFSQIAGSRGGDFSELRSYLVSKLLWNVDANVDSIIHQFLKDFYGEAAAPYIYEYIKLREGAMLGSQIPLWIYDTPVTHKDGMLNDQLMRRYKVLFDKAEASVASEPIFLARVREERLPIQYSELEIERTKADGDKSMLKDKVELFRSRAAGYGVAYLNERNNLIEDYAKQYVERNLPSEKQSLAKASKIEFVQEPNKPYNTMLTTLTDGLYGGATFNDGWVGWEGKDAEFIIDLGEVKEIQTVETDFLHKLGSWVLLPKSIRISSSIDKKSFNLLGQKEIAEDQDLEVKFVSFPIQAKSKIKARYIKLEIETIGLCPPWHYGVGNPAWFFVDEVNVY